MKRISKTEIKEMRSQSKKNRIMFAFTLPTVILYTIFFLVTMLIGVYYSFTDWNGISKDYTFVGLKNYVKVLTDERFREALWFNIGYTIALVVLLIVIPLTIALALNRIRRLSTLFRSIYFIPAVISMVTVGLIWNELFYRAVPAIGEMLNIEALSTSPLGNPKLAAIAIMVVNIWQGCAIPTVLFIAGLQSVPKDLLEAATIDGAGNWARFWNVIIPYLIPVLNMVIITQAKAGLTVFDYIKVMTNGGPAQSTEAVGLLIYRHAINEGKFSTSVAESMILFVIVGVAILLQECSDEENLCTNAKLLQQKGVKNIVVTLGGEGSYLLKEDHTEKRLYADKTVHVVDTTAAGDSYVAGLAVALSRGDSLDEAVELASRVSNIVVTRKGAQPSIPSFEELEEAPE